MRYIRIVFLLLSFIYNEKLQADEYAISGYVKDKNNGNPLIGANIFIEGTSIGVASDKNGYYEIDNIERGNYTFKVSYIGYKTSSEMVELMSNQKKYILDFNLNYTTIEGKEITVTAQAKGQMDAINRQLNSKSLVNLQTGFKNFQTRMQLKQLLECQESPFREKVAKEIRLLFEAYLQNIIMLQ